MQTDPLDPDLLHDLNDLMDTFCGHYVLAGHTPVRCTDWLVWAEAQEGPGRQVGDDTGDGWRLSTVFLGLAPLWDHAPPELFETMLFADGAYAKTLGRYATWEAAVHGHRVFLGKVPWLLPQMEPREDTNSTDRGIDAPEAPDFVPLVYAALRRP